MWQVSGRSDIQNFEDVVRLDLEYIDNWSVWLDIKILFQTVFCCPSPQGGRMTANKKRQRWLAAILRIFVFAAAVGFVTFSVQSYQKKKEAEMTAEMRKSEREKNGLQTGDEGAVRSLTTERNTDRTL